MHTTHSAHAHPSARAGSAQHSRSSSTSTCACRPMSAHGQERHSRALAEQRLRNPSRSGEGVLLVIAGHKLVKPFILQYTHSLLLFMPRKHSAIKQLAQKVLCRPRFTAARVHLHTPRQPRGGCWRRRPNIVRQAPRDPAPQRPRPAERPSPQRRQPPPPPRQASGPACARGEGEAAAGRRRGRTWCKTAVKRGAVRGRNRRGPPGQRAWAACR